MKKIISQNRITALLIFSLLLIIIFPLILIFDSKSLQDSRGIGIIVTFVTIFVGLVGLSIDYLLFKFIKNKLILNIIELVMILMFLYIFWPR